jgi:peptide-methionine (R)-S-oxide reductase
MSTTFNRRHFLKAALGGLGVIALTPLLKSGPALAETIETLIKTNEEWKKILTPEQYNILREEGTEHPFTSALLDEHREGIFACVACDLPLFPSKFKYDSGTGWPSFFDTISNHVSTSTDNKLLYTRTEYHCARCGGHHGHVFNDGPDPTGLRYCNNGVALKFTPKS